MDTKLYMVDAMREPRGQEMQPLLEGANVRRLVRSTSGGRIWAFGPAPKPELPSADALPPPSAAHGTPTPPAPSIVGAPLPRAAEPYPDSSHVISVYLVDENGKSLLARPIPIGDVYATVPVSADRLLVYSADGRIVLLDESGVRQERDDLSVRNRSDLYDLMMSELAVVAGGVEDTAWLVDLSQGIRHVAVVNDSLVVRQVCGRRLALERSGLAQPDGSALWFNGDGNLCVARPAEAGDFRCLETKVRDARRVYPAGDGTHGWIKTDRGFLAYGPASEAAATIEFEHGLIRLSEGKLEVEGIPYVLDRLEDLNVRWPTAADLGARAATIKVSMHESGVTDGAEHYEARKEGSKAIQQNSAWPLPRSLTAEPLYDLVIDYEDQAGSKLTLVLEKVPFAYRPLDRGWVRTLLACAGALLLFVLPVLLEARSRLARGWMPFGAVLASTAGGGGAALIPAAQKLNINFPTVVGVTSGALLLGLAAGVVSPVAFRLLAPSKPFQWLVPVAVSVRRIRRGLMRGYIKAAKDKLRKKREAARGETYVPLPADVFLSEGSPSSPAPEALADAIADFLGDPEQGGNVLIEAPGGRGKSALLRQVMQRMLARFEEDPDRPLPVLCEAGGPSLADALRRALEAHALGPDALEAQLLRGDYVIVIDGLVESPFEPEDITRFLDGPLGGRVRLLLAGRPHRYFRSAFEASARWMRVEPQMLHDNDEQHGTLKTFVDAYRKDYVLPETVKKACRSHDGAYLPILVRLAIPIGDTAVTTLSDLYETSIRELLKAKRARGEDAALLAWARSYCLATYWRNGLRTVRASNEEERENLQKLKDAGLLVQAEDPRDLRFFHDSMQSYLTASALFAQEAQQETWDCLHRAAANPIFVRDPTDLLPGGASELFAMCLFVFGPVPRLRDEIKRQLERWADQHDDDLSKLEIASTLPESVRGEILGHATISPGDALKKAVEACDDKDLRVLGALYANVAVKVWPLRARGALAIPWDKAESDDLIRVLAIAYRNTDEIEALAKKVPIDLLDWERSLTPRKAWRSLLDEASIQRKLDALLDRILEDTGKALVHDELRRLRGALWPAPPPPP
ncbi:hypothetical protein [Sorangium sp. So ce385]|uniref:hypothetical protein n=1 Tax=Sorangium sp. So ce385 TaxID=3133308 RepID=UPI003F5C1F23